MIRNSLSLSLYENVYLFIDFYDKNECWRRKHGPLTAVCLWLYIVWQCTKTLEHMSAQFIIYHQIVKIRNEKHFFRCWYCCYYCSSSFSIPSMVMTMTTTTITTTMIQLLDEMSNIIYTSFYFMPKGSQKDADFEVLKVNTFARFTSNRNILRILTTYTHQYVHAYER